MTGQPLRVPGLLCLEASGKLDEAVLHVGDAAGWVAPKGLRSWSREISLVVKADLSEAARGELGVTLPEALAGRARLPHARLAAEASKLVAVETAIANRLMAKRVRVHTVGSDRVTGDFYYLAQGGKTGAVRMQGNIFGMLAPALTASPDSATLEACLDGLIDRILAMVSRGVLSEESVELAAALSSLGEPARDAAAKLETLEGYLVLAETSAAKHEEEARAIVEAVRRATRLGRATVELPLFGTARRRTQPKLVIEYAEGESNARRKATLPERSRWFVAYPQPDAKAPSSVSWRPEETKPAPKSPNLFVGSVKLDAMKVVKEARRVATTIVDHLTTLPDADVEVRIEIRAKVPAGVRDDVVRTVGENAKKLRFTTASFRRE